MRGRLVQNRYGEIELQNIVIFVLYRSYIDLCYYEQIHSLSTTLQMFSTLCNLKIEWNILRFSARLLEIAVRHVNTWSPPSVHFFASNSRQNISLKRHNNHYYSPKSFATVYESSSSIKLHLIMFKVRFNSVFSCCSVNIPRGLEIELHLKE